MSAVSSRAVLSGTLASAAAHAAVGAGLYGWLAWSEPAPIVAELDLTMSTIFAAASNAGGGRGAKRAPEWVERLAAKPAAALAAQTAEEVRRQGSLPSDCAGPCADEPLVGRGWGGAAARATGSSCPPRPPRASRAGCATASPRATTRSSRAARARMGA
ncbi:MAG: hypothetical protein M0D55_06960 [Elusimicrobiota bacterium]|nr:MAG: hypothetical protein M0D55_06960 [Elusimicrobiota bacterium]